MIHKIQTLNATDIACHSRKPGATCCLIERNTIHKYRHLMQQTLHVIAMNLGGMLSHTTQHDAQTLNATDIACHSCEAGAVLSNTTQPSTQTPSTVDITYHNHEPLSLHERL